jgi:hypothetical protein
MTPTTSSTAVSTHASGEALPPPVDSRAPLGFLPMCLVQRVCQGRLHLVVPSREHLDYPSTADKGASYALTATSMRHGCRAVPMSLRAGRPHASWALRLTGPCQAMVAVSAVSGGLVFGRGPSSGLVGRIFFFLF